MDSLISSAKSRSLELLTQDTISSINIKNKLGPGLITEKHQMSNKVIRRDCQQREQCSNEMTNRFQTTYINPDKLHKKTVYVLTISDDSVIRFGHIKTYVIYLTSIFKNRCGIYSQKVDKLVSGDRSLKKPCCMGVSF